MTCYWMLVLPMTSSQMNCIRHEQRLGSLLLLWRCPRCPTHTSEWREQGPVASVLLSWWVGWVDGIGE